MAASVYNELRIEYPQGKIYFSESDLGGLQHALKAEKRIFGATLLFRATEEADTDIYFKQEKEGYVLEEIKGDINELTGKTLLDKLLYLKGLNTQLKLTIAGYENSLDYKVGESI